MVSIIDISSEKIVKFFEGVGGEVRELVLGEHNHVGGIIETEILTLKAEINENDRVLDIGCGKGGPAIWIAKRYKCKIVGIDLSPVNIQIATAKSVSQDLEKYTVFRVADATNLPFFDNTFDVVIGQDAWCYVLEKEKLIEEAARVLKKGGRIAFTDWIETELINDDERIELNSFMRTPYLETIDGYIKMLKKNNFSIVESENLQNRFISFVKKYDHIINELLKEQLLNKLGEEDFEKLSSGIKMWLKAAQEHKVSQCRIIAVKN